MTCCQGLCCHGEESSGTLCSPMHILPQKYPLVVTVGNAHVVPFSESETALFVFANKECAFLQSVPNIEH